MLTTIHATIRLKDLSFGYYPVTHQSTQENNFILYITYYYTNTLYYFIWKDYMKPKFLQSNLYWYTLLHTNINL